MGTFKDNGIVLRESKSGESDKMLTVLLKGKGKVSVYARGARKLKSSFCVSCSLFCYSDFVLFQKSDFLSLTSADVINPYTKIQSDYDAFRCACFMAEMVDKIILREMDTEKILKLLALSLNALDKGIDPDIVRPAFAFRIMSYEGFIPVLDSCRSCKTAEASYFSGEGLVCKDCACVCDVFISKGAIRAIDYIVNAETKRMFSFQLDGHVKRELLAACDLFVKQNLGIVFKSDSLEK